MGEPGAEAVGCDPGSKWQAGEGLGRCAVNQLELEAVADADAVGAVEGLEENREGAGGGRLDGGDGIFAVEVDDRNRQSRRDGAVLAFNHGVVGVSGIAARQEQPDLVGVDVAGQQEALDGEGELVVAAFESVALEVAEGGRDGDVDPGCRRQGEIGGPDEACAGGREGGGAGPGLERRGADGELDVEGGGFDEGRIEGLGEVDQDPDRGRGVGGLVCRRGRDATASQRLFAMLAGVALISRI